MLQVLFLGWNIPSQLMPTASPQAGIPAPPPCWSQGWFLWVIAVCYQCLSSDSASKDVLPQCCSQWLLWTCKCLPEYTQQRPQHSHTEPTPSKVKLLPFSLVLVHRRGWQKSTLNGPHKLLSLSSLKSQFWSIFNGR